MVHEGLAVNAPSSAEPVHRGVSAKARVAGRWGASAQPRRAGGLAGASYWFRAASPALRSGMRVTGHVGTGGVARAGVSVPEAAIVWHAGRAWVYVSADEPDVFQRVAVTVRERLPGGWFAAGGPGPGTPVVVKGAQLLLSEELEYQIRNENED